MATCAQIIATNDRHRYRGGMTSPDPSGPPPTVAATPEQVNAARTRAKDRLAEADRRRTPDRKRRLLKLLGLPTTTA